MGTDDPTAGATPRPRRSMARRTPAWEAPADVVELMGDISGNGLNGWGETQDRQPTLVMWANPSGLAHGRVQHLHRRLPMVDAGRSAPPCRQHAPEARPPRHRLRGKF